jgi:hypothetical protein
VTATGSSETAWPGRAGGVASCGRCRIGPVETPESVRSGHPAAWRRMSWGATSNGYRPVGSGVVARAVPSAYWDELGLRGLSGAGIATERLDGSLDAGLVCPVVVGRGQGDPGPYPIPPPMWFRRPGRVG